MPWSPEAVLPGPVFALISAVKWREKEGEEGVGGRVRGRGEEGGRGGEEEEEKKELEPAGRGVSLSRLGLMLHGKLQVKKLPQVFLLGRSWSTLRKSCPGCLALGTMWCLGAWEGPGQEQQQQESG